MYAIMPDEKKSIVVLTKREVEVVTYALCKIWSENNDLAFNEKKYERRADEYWKLYDVFSNLRSKM